MTAPETPPLPVERALEAEYAFLRAAPGQRRRAPDAAAASRGPHTATARPEFAALCLSGGGVRSGSFGLGVLQGLARAGLLGKFDYLSTVSGGGYIGGWFTAWRFRAHARGEADPSEQLGHDVEPEPVTRLRRLIKFLDPRTGTLSADVWTLGGTMFRNLLVNWMVLIPLIAAAAMLPRMYLGILGLPSQPELVSQATLDWWYLHDWIPIVIMIAIATTYAALQLPSLGHRSDGPRRFADLVPGAGPRRARPVVGAPLLGLAVRGRDLARDRAPDVGGGDGPAVDRRGRVQQTLLAAVDLDGRRRSRARRPPDHLVGASLSDRPRPSRPADLRRHRSAHLAGAALPADHRLHRPRQPRHDRR